MPLPWVRLDCNIGTHDKVLALIADPSPKRWQALASYFVALGWCGGQETDGVIRTVALPFVHGTPVTARLLVKYGFWHEYVDGWTIHNYADRQQMSDTTKEIVTKLSEGGKKGACAHWHAPGCWKEGQGCRNIPKP
jgi:hypothetical protein